MQYRFDDIAINSIAKKKPTTSDKDTYLGLDHLDSENLTVTRFGSDVAPIGEKLIMKKGDVLFGKRRAYQRKVAIAPFDGIFSAHGMVLRPKEKVVYKDFFPLFISSDYFLDAAIKISVGSLSPTINWSALKELVFELPPIDRQKQISKILWAVIETKNTYKTLFLLTEQIVKSRFVEMFGDPVTNPMRWEVYKLGALSSLITKGTSPNWQGYEYTQDSTQTLFVTSENIREGYVELEHPKFIEDAFNEKQRRSILQKGDFLINIVGASIGRAAQYMLGGKANINQAIALVRLNSTEINDGYLLHYLNSPRALEMYASMQVSVARANLSLQNISDLEIILPPLPLQNRFAEFVRQADKSKFELQRTIGELEATYKSILRENLG